MAMAMNLMNQRRQAAAAPQLSWATQLTTVLLGTWLMIGLFVDGWAHNNLAKLETFFTPWHALFYSGFLVSAAWIVWTVARHVRPQGGLLTAAGRAAIPAGYDLGLLGVLIFGVGGVGDMIWHILFGIEKSYTALLSPTHVLLFIGCLLILTTPLRSAWQDPNRVEAPAFRDFLPTLLSATMGATMVAFFFMYFWAFNNGWQSVEIQHMYAPLPHWVRETGDTMGVTNFIMTSLFLMWPLLLMLRRWRLPFGSVTLLFSVLGILMSALHAFSTWPTAVGLIVFGLVGDLLLRLLRVTPERVVAYRVFATVLPLLVFGTYLVAVAMLGELGWAPEIFGGAWIYTGLGSLALSLLMAPNRQQQAPE